MCIKNPYGTGLLIAAISAFAGALPLAAESEHDNLPGMGVQPVEYFYTGKPYDVDSETYTYRYRNYDPELNRWTTVDPSGFPDGANNIAYMAVPTHEFDWQGLFTLSTTTPSPATSYDPTGRYFAEAFNISHVSAGSGMANLNHQLDQENQTYGKSPSLPSLYNLPRRADFSQNSHEQAALL